MEGYKHSVFLETEKCKGCTNCLKRCPTEAIRIRDGHAVINPDDCIDCGECIRVCEQKAKRAVYEKLEDLDSSKYLIALPAPSISRNVALPCTSQARTRTVSSPDT